VVHVVDRPRGTDSPPPVKKLKIFWDTTERQMNFFSPELVPLFSYTAFFFKLLSESVTVNGRPCND